MGYDDWGHEYYNDRLARELHSCLLRRGLGENSQEGFNDWSERGGTAGVLVGHVTRESWECIQYSSHQYPSFHAFVSVQCRSLILANRLEANEKRARNCERSFSLDYSLQDRLLIVLKRRDRIGSTLRGPLVVESSKARNRISCEIDFTRSLEISRPLLLQFVHNESVESI